MAKTDIITRILKAYSESGSVKEVAAKLNLSYVDTFRVLEEQDALESGPREDKGPFRPRPLTPTRVRQLVRDRDGHACKLCGRREKTRPLPVHLINRMDGDFRTENAVTLCNRCRKIALGPAGNVLKDALAALIEGETVNFESAQSDLSPEEKKNGEIYEFAPKKT